MTDIPDETLDYWQNKRLSYLEKQNTTERRMWRAWSNFKKWKAMIRRLGQKKNGREHPESLRHFSAKTELEKSLMDMVNIMKISSNKNYSVHLVPTTNTNGCLLFCSTFRVL